MFPDFRYRLIMTRCGFFASPASVEIYRHLSYVDNDGYDPITL